MNFNVITKEVEAVTSTEDTLIIRGIASTTNKDLDDEVVTMAALESMCKQIDKLNLHLDHDHGFKGLIGAIKSAELKDNELWITAEIFQEHSQGIRDKLAKGAKLGLSIGGLPVRDKENPNLIKDFNLLEISLTPMPANQDTQGSVEIIKSCISGACYDYLKEINNMRKTLKSKRTEDERPLKEEEDKLKKPEPEEDEEETRKSEDEPEYVTIDELGDILNEFMAEKEDQIKADILQALESESNKSEDDDEEEEPEKEDTLDNEKSDDEEEDEEKKPISKYASYKQMKTKTCHSFLNSEERDHLGRNKSYL